MKTLKSLLSESQELLKPVGLDECAALNGGFIGDIYKDGRLIGHRYPPTYNGVTAEVVSTVLHQKG